MSVHSACTFRILGSGNTAQNLLTIMNTGTARIVLVRRMSFLMDATAALAAVMPMIRVCRISSASDGALLTKVDWNSNEPSNASVEVRGGSSGDGTNAAITATPGNTLWQQYGMRMHTLVGQVLAVDNWVVPTIADTLGIRLGQNEGLLCHVVASVGSSNPNTNHYVVNVVWEEV